MLPQTQKLGYDISPTIALSTETLSVYNDDYLSYPIITSNNAILIIGYDGSTDIVTLYKYNQDLILESQTCILYGIELLIYSTDGPFPIYQEYNNRSYYVHHFTFVKDFDRSTFVGQFVHLLLVLELVENKVNILWQFDHIRTYEPGWYGKFYQPVVYKNYVFFQHETDYPATYITRYVFNLNNGFILWNKTDTKSKYVFSGPPILHETNINGNDCNILIIFDDKSYYFQAIDIKTGNIHWTIGGPYSENFDFINRNSDRYFVSISKEYNLLFRACTSHTYSVPAICIFNVFNGEFVTIVAHQFDHTQDVPVRFRSFAVNTNNGYSDFILFTDTKTIYYNMHITASNITFEQNKIISKQFRHFNWIDKNSNILYSIDGYYGNGCGESSTQEYFIVSKSGSESNSVCIGLDGNYPVIPNKQTSNEQYIYFTSDSKLVAVKSSIKHTVTRRLINQYNNVTQSVTSNVTELYSTTQFVTTETTNNTDDKCGITEITNTSTVRPYTTTSNSVQSDNVESTASIWSILGSIFVCILYLGCCYMQYGRHCGRCRWNYWNRGQIQHQQQQRNDESDFYPKKPMRSGNKVNVDVKIINNTDGKCTDDRKQENESIEMIAKQPTLSYSAMNCVICLDILLDNESSKLVCGHKFHTHCIEEYNEINTLCPLCREQIVFE